MTELRTGTCECPAPGGCATIADLVDMRLVRYRARHTKGRRWWLGPPVTYLLCRPCATALGDGAIHAHPHTHEEAPCSA